MPNKPDKFGLKFWVLADLSTKYVCNMIPFLGKSEDKSSDVLLGESVVMKLMEPFGNLGYCVTTDIFLSTCK